MERIDKFISNIWYGSRKDVKKYIKDSLIAVNWEIISKSDFKINYGDIISIWEEDIEFKEFVYVMLNKPSGYVSSTIDEWGHESFLALMEDCPYAPLVNPVWRLDVDTEGLLLLTNDWDLTHKLISPKKDIFKKYYVEIENEITDKEIEKLEKGVKINVETNPYITKKAKVEIIDKKKLHIFISEGKFHQIKKMLEAVDNKVTYLKRLNIWSLELDNSLETGEWRYLEKKEVDALLTKS